MREPSLFTDERGVSTTLSYALNLTLSAMLISGLLFAAGDVVGDQRHAAVREELEVIGQRIAEGIQSADRLKQTGPSSLSVSIRVPERVSGSDYTVTVDTSGSTPELVLVTTDSDITVSVPVAIDGTLAETTIDGGPLEIQLISGKLEIEER